MITYLTAVVTVFFLLIFLARKFNKKFNLYSNNEEKRMTIVAIGLFSVFWPFTLFASTVFGFFTFVVLSSSKLLK